MPSRLISFANSFIGLFFYWMVEGDKGIYLKGLKPYIGSKVGYII